MTKKNKGLRSKLKLLASLKLTVTLFVLGIFLVFVGTLAQVDNGIWTIIHQYFRCFFAFVEWKVFFVFFHAEAPKGGFYFPGGYILGGALLINLISAHAITFKSGAKGKRLAWGIIFLIAGVVVTYAVLIGWKAPAIAATEDDAYWRVLYRLCRGGFAALIFLIACQLLFKRRAGIVLIHGGIIFLILGELFTALFAIEAQMTIKEGETVNFIDHSLETELAFTEISNPDHDLVTVIPNEFLVPGETISTSDLPFDIKVKHYMINSTFPAPINSIPEEKRSSYPTYTGLGAEYFIEEKKEGSGVDTEMKKDTPSVVVELIDRTSKESLGTYIFSLWFYPNHVGRSWDLAQEIKVHDKTYMTHLRYRREYLTTPEGNPFSLRLEKFSHDTYIGTDIPSNFASDIQLINKNEGTDRHLKIWMNNPLRYAKRTFYQASFLQDNVGTILQVVRNDSWMIPYLSCMFVLAGMLSYFGLIFITFLKK
jgi:hypothetical protein